MRINLLLLFLSFYQLGVSQDPIPPSELEGIELRQWLLNNWHSPWHDDLGYDDARMEMFGNIDAEGGLIECVYTGFTQAAGDVTFPDPINTEHTVPQSYFDGSSPMKNDLHHIFPSHGIANSLRGNLAFGEIDDSETDTWIISNAGSYVAQSNIPGGNIDDYSEVLNTIAFEPREEKKGNTARAIFYFYTMYPDDLESQYSDINAAGDLNTLYSWHVMDPPDALEIERDEQIQAVQGNYNPYVRMPELAAPAWGFVSDLDEYLLEVQLIHDQDAETIHILNEPMGTKLSLFNAMGQRILTQNDPQLISTRGLAPGIYFVRLTDYKGRSGLKKLFVR